MNVEIVTGESSYALPLIVHIPHSSQAIPPEIRKTFCLDDYELERELLCMTDWCTDRLFHGAVQLGGTLFINRLSRLVVDPERFPDESQEVMAAKGMGAVYTQTANGRPLRRSLPPNERTNLLETYFHPYAKAFTDLVSQMLGRHGRCVILDGHSFPSVPLPYELDQETNRPQICLGTDHVHTPESLVREVEDLCTARGLHVARNKPFAGTYVPLDYWRKDQRVTSLMMEIRRDLYMNETTGVETSGLTQMQDLISSVMHRLA